MRASIGVHCVQLCFSSSETILEYFNIRPRPAPPFLRFLWLPSRSTLLTSPVQLFLPLNSVFCLVCTAHSVQISSSFKPRQLDWLPYVHSMLLPDRHHWMATLLPLLLLFFVYFSLLQYFPFKYHQSLIYASL